MTLAFRRALLCVCALSFVCLPERIYGQATSSRQATTQPQPQRVLLDPGSAIKVYVMTMGPGNDVWERFGHDALWIHDPSRRADSVDIAWNWGMFDFNQPHFFARFIKGDMLYWMAGYGAQRTLDVFAAENRSVWAQELNLTSQQKLALRDFVEWNGRPENRFYHYDYYRDNCSSRVRDALDRVLGGQIKQATAQQPTGTTYRSHTRILAEGDVPIYTGLELAMGHPIDKQLSSWEEMFLPLKLRDHLRTLHVRDAAGREQPLVLSEQELFHANRTPLPTAPPRWMAYYFMGGLVFGGLLVVLAIATVSGRRAARHAFTALAVLWCFVLGLLGTVITGLWIFTDHYVTYQNENVLQINPLPLALVVMIPLLVYRNRARHGAVRAGYTLALLSLIGFFMQILPPFNQVNGEVIALVLPVWLALAWSLSVLANPVLLQRSRAGTAMPVPDETRAAA